MIVSVTGMHAQVSHIADYIDPSHTTTKIRDGVRTSDVQSSIQAVVLGAMFATRQPMLLDNVDHLLLDDVAVEVWRDFRNQLSKLSEDINAKNTQRGGFHCDTMNPAKLLYSVSV